MALAASSAKPLAAQAVEPIIDIPEQQLHIRVEDTILVTPNGAEILSTGLPKEVRELLPLVGSRSN